MFFGSTRHALGYIDIRFKETLGLRGAELTERVSRALALVDLAGLERRRIDQHEVGVGIAHPEHDLRAALGERATGAAGDEPLERGELLVPVRLQSIQPGPEVGQSFGAKPEAASSALSSSVGAMVASSAIRSNAVSSP
jgi:hypothetical protein